MPSVAELQKLYVLVADEDKTACAQIEEAISIAGLFKGVVLAHNGTDAMAKIGKQKFGLIIVDYELTRIKGVEIIKQIRRGMGSVVENKETTLILISNFDDVILHEEGNEAGANLVLSKPLEIESTVASIIKTLGL